MEIIHKIKLDNRDINEAIALYLSQNSVDIQGKTLDIDITAGRKGTGVYANITLTSSSEGTYKPVDLVVDEEVTSETTEEEEEAILDAVTQKEDTATETEEESEENTSLFQ